MLKPFPLYWCLQYDGIWLNKTFTVVALEWFFTRMKSIHAPPTPIILYAAPITEHYRSSIKDYQSCRGMYGEAFHTLSVRHSVQKSCHSGGNWMVFHECEAFHALSGLHSVLKSCHSGGTSIFFLNFSTWLNFTDWMGNKKIPWNKIPGTESSRTEFQEWKIPGVENSRTVNSRENINYFEKIPGQFSSRTEFSRIF